MECGGYGEEWRVCGGEGEWMMVKGPRVKGVEEGGGRGWKVKGARGEDMLKR